MKPDSKRGMLFKGLSRGRGLLLLSALLLAAALLACQGQSTPDPSEQAASSPVNTVQPVKPTPEQIEVQARLDFPRRAELTFERAGEVEEILVSPGQKVTEGEILARLDSDHFPVLEEELARLRFQIAEARDNIRKINKDYRNEPVTEAQRVETVARLELANTQAQDFFEDIDQNYNDRLTALVSERDQAKVALDAATDALAEVERDLEADHGQVLAVAEQAKVDAELALDRAMEQLEDYKKDLSDEAIRAGDRVTEADLFLDQANERLEDYRKDLAESAVRARDRVTESELALDVAQQTLEDFLAEHDRQVIRARTVVGAADETLDNAKAPLTQFLRTPIRDTEVDGNPVDVAKLNSLQAAVDLAEANLEKAQEDLEELKEGPDSFRVQELESNVSVAELNLAQARDDLAELEEGPDPILLQELESSVRVAELNLGRTKEDLADLEEGPDILVLNQLQSRVDLARVNLSQAEKRLAEEKEGPDPLILPRLELNVTLAQQRLDLAERNVRDLLDDGPDRKSVPLMEQEMVTRLAQIDELYEAPDALQLVQINSLNAAISLALERMEDIEEEMEETLLRAPFDGLVVLLNVEEDDRVSKNSRVMELLDPTNITVQGFVDATYIQYLLVGMPARVAIDSLPGQELTGQVSFVAEDPRTERGIISYEIEIEVDMPPGSEVPPRLSAVDVVLIP